jgi:hypothetical protein
MVQFGPQAPVGLSVPAVPPPRRSCTSPVGRRYWASYPVVIDTPMPVIVAFAGMANPNAVESRSPVGPLKALEWM